MAGEYREIEEKSFFDVGKKHECVVCHFAASSRRNSVVPGGGSSGGFGAGACAMLDALLPELGARYELTAFVRINVASASFLCRNFSIETSSCPALVLIKNGRPVQKLAGLDAMGLTVRRRISSVGSQMEAGTAAAISGHRRSRSSPVNGIVGIDSTEAATDFEALVRSLEKTLSSYDVLAAKALDAIEEGSEDEDEDQEEEEAGGGRRRVLSDAIAGALDRSSLGGKHKMKAAGHRKSQSEPTGMIVSATGASAQAGMGANPVCTFANL